MTTFRKLALPLLGGICAVSLSAPAIAQEQEIVVTANMKLPEGLEPVKMVVSIKDLDLSTPAGASKMKRRITAVIERFCAPPSRAAGWQKKDAKTCSDFAWSTARPQMDEALRKANAS